MAQDLEGDTDTDSNATDYGAVEIPAKPPEEYHWTERRAEILDIVEQKGHPRALDQAELAERYDVSESQISRDLDRLAEHVRNRLENRDERALVVDTVVQRCVQELMNEGKYRAAAKTMLEWEEWAAGFADLEQLHERVAELEAQVDNTALDL